MAPKKKNPLLASIDPSSRGYGDFLEALADPSQDVSSITDAPAPKVPSPDEDGDLASVAASPRKPAAAPPAPPSSEPSGASDIVKDYIAKKYGFQGDLSDDALKGAEGLANESRFNANMGQAAATIGNAIGTPLKTVDTSFYDKLSKQADGPERDILTRRAAAKDDLAYGDAQASLDPNSPASVASRKLYGNVLKMAGVENPEELAGMSAKDIKDFIDRPAEGIAKLKQSRDMKEMSLAQTRELTGARLGVLGQSLGLRTDNAAAKAANDVTGKGVEALKPLFQKVIRGMHNVRDDMTVATAHEVLQDYASALSGANATSDYKIQSVSAPTLAENLTKLESFISSNPNMPAPKGIVQFLKIQGPRLAEGFENSIRSEVQAHSQGKHYGTPQLEAAKNEAAGYYTSGKYFDDTKKQFGLDAQPGAGAEIKRLPDGSVFQKVGGHWVEVKH